MDKPSRNTSFRIKSFLTGLQKTISALPTEAEKEELQTTCTVLIEFLSDLKKNMKDIPSIEDMNTVRETIQSLESLLSKAETSPALSAAFGLRKHATAKKRSPNLTDEEKTRAKAALADFESLQIEEIRLKLSNEGSYSVRELRGIASAIGIRSTRSLSRVDLVHRIATKIANYRGYQSLGGAKAPF